jgi:PQQ system protein
MGARYKWIVVTALAIELCGCTYTSLLRPSVLEQLRPPVAELLNELPEVDQPNEAIISRLFATGGLSHAEKTAAGVMYDRIRVPKGQFIWEPALIVMPHAGVLELEFQNEDIVRHAALMPSSAGRQLLELPMHTAGRVNLRLDQPGLYWFGCPVENHVGRGMLGFVLVRGEVPPTARLDRPPQPRPGD